MEPMPIAAKFIRRLVWASAYDAEFANGYPTLTPWEQATMTTSVILVSMLRCNKEDGAKFILDSFPGWTKRVRRDSMKLLIEICLSAAEEYDIPALPINLESI